MSTLRALGALFLFLAQRAVFVLFLACAAALVFATIMAGLGFWPWLELTAAIGGTPIEQAGTYAQIILAVLASGLCFFLPSNARMMRLENSHRRFSIGMQDVARAYAAVHAADRGDTFRMSSEFDAVRERLSYLRDHPDLDTLEPAVLEVAAQMSHISRELAEVYSDERVSRARMFLKERQAEVENFNASLEHAKSVATDLKHWVHEVELEESVAAAQLERLKAEIREVLPELGTERSAAVDTAALDNGVVEMPKAAE